MSYRAKAYRSFIRAALAWAGAVPAIVLGGIMIGRYAAGGF